MSKKENKIKGNIGEHLACKYLQNLDYEIIEKNFTSYNGEIDIVAIEKKEIVFVEVKTRCQTMCGKPAESVNYTKIIQLYKVAEYYLYLHNLLNCSVRFDVIEIYLYNNKKYKITHIKNAIQDYPKGER